MSNVQSPIPNIPSFRLGVFEDPGLNGFVFGGLAHWKVLESSGLHKGSFGRMVTKFSASGSRTNKGPRRASLVKSAVFFCPHGVHFGEVLSLASVLGVSAT